MLSSFLSLSPVVDLTVVCWRILKGVGKNRACKIVWMADNGDLVNIRSNG